jgi:hypothetical protein
MTTAPPLIRTSERKDFKKCPWLWNESWVNGITSARTPTWSWFGTAYHSGMEVRYKRGKKRGKLLDMMDAAEHSMDGEKRRVWTSLDGEDQQALETEIVDGKELMYAMFKGYIEHYGEEKDITVIHSEQSFQIEVPDPRDPSRVLCVYAGTWDSLWLIDGIYWIVDHKTRKTIPADLSFYDIDDQSGSYLWVAPEVLVHLGVLTKKEAKQILGLIFNIARKAMPDTRPRDAEGYTTNKPTKDHYLEALGPMFDIPGYNAPGKLPTVAALEAKAEAVGVRVVGERSARQPTPLFARYENERTLKHRATQGRRVQDEAIWMEAARNGTMPIFKTPSEDCNRCQLKEYCEADEYDYNEGQELKAVIMKTRDPYRDHREAMERGGVVLERKK